MAITGSANFFDDELNYRKQYRDGVVEQYGIFDLDRATNRFIPLSKLKLQGKQYVVTLEDVRYSGGRANTDLLADPPTSHKNEFYEYTVTADETAANNHMHRIMGSIRISVVDLIRYKNGSTAEKVAILERTIRQRKDNLAEALAIHRNIPSTGILAIINGTKVINDHPDYASCSTYVNGSTSCRVKIDNGAIAYFTKGMIVDIKDASTSGDTYADVIVTDVNPADNSIGLGQYAGAPANFDDVADNDAITYNNGYNQNIISWGQWFGTGAILGITRTSADNQFLCPRRLRGGSASAAFNKSMLDQLAIAMAQTSKDDEGNFLQMCASVYQSFVDDIDAAALKVVDLNDKNPLAKYGYTGATYYHPQFGLLAIDWDPYAPPTEVRLIKPRTWEMLSLTDGEPMVVPDSANGGDWGRLTSDTVNNGKSMFYQSDSMLTVCDVCTAPRLNAHILNVT